MKQLFILLLSFFGLALSAQNRYLEPVFDQITITKDIQYGTNATVLTVSQLGEAIPQPLLLDFYEPAGDILTTRPVVLVLPGGTYLPPSSNGNCQGSKNDSSVVEICTRLAKMGYTAAAIEYRLGWNPVASTQLVQMFTYVNAMYRGIQDARTAIRFFKKTAVEDANPYRVDTSRIVLWGESSGGQVALGAAYANSPNDWIDPSLSLGSPNIYAIIPQMIGNIWGTDVGIVDSGTSALTGLPIGDTLCYPNWPGYSSDFQLCVSMAGWLINLPWVNAGEAPAVLFHAPSDAWVPCQAGVYGIQLPLLLLPITAASGACSIATQLDIAGNNQVFWDADISDCVTSNAKALNGGLEGFYPFVGLTAENARPWEWTAPCPNSANEHTDGAFARRYLDTIFAYFAPRACAALALCNAQLDPNGLCGPQAMGKVFWDMNQNGAIDAGEQALSDVVIELQPGGFHAVSGSLGKFSINASPGDYTLDVPNPPNYYATLNTPIAVTVPVGADLVQNVGLKTTATANDLQVSLTPLTAAKPGFATAFVIKWKNAGTTQLSGTATLTVDPHYLVTGSTPTANISGNVATWDFTNLAPLQSGSARLKVLLPSNVPLGTQLASTANAEPTGVADETPLDNFVSVAQAVVGAFDPNDKAVNPVGNVTADILQDHEDWLDYTVRFQNTGTAFAYNVHLVDTLSELLNLNTLEIVSSSHPMRWEIGGKGTVTWFFDQINLPSTLQDEPASHGFVRYRIRPRLPFEGLLNETVHNFADIYFDFNAPVRTNTTETKFTESIGVNAPFTAATLHIFPNPAGDFALISWPIQAKSEAFTVRVLNAAGEEVLLREITAASNVSYEKIDVKNWPRGLYFVQLQGRTQTISGRFVKG